MIFLKYLLVAGISFAAASLPSHDHSPSPPGRPDGPGGPKGPSGCGDINVFMTGLPPYHPLVVALGLDPAMIDRMLRADAARIIAKGYNLRGKLAAPRA